MTAKTALIIVDLQNDFLPGGALAVPNGDEVIPVINNLIEGYSVVVATQDWHPADHGSFAANHPDANLFDIVDLNGLPQVLWPTHCVQNTFGAAFHDEVRTENIQKVFVKGANPAIDSYSGFFDNGKRQETGLGNWLHERGVEAVDVVGLALDYCVKATAIDAASLGFDTRVIMSATRAVNVNPADAQNAEIELVAAGVEVV